MNKPTMINEDGVYQQNNDGSWSEGVPLPFYTRTWYLAMRYQCWAKNSAKDGRCNMKFKTPREFEQHYIKMHTSGNKYTRTPQGMTLATQSKKGE